MKAVEPNMRSGNGTGSSVEKATQAVARFAKSSAENCEGLAASIQRAVKEGVRLKEPTSTRRRPA